MLMIVFGAGASFDSLPSRPPQQHTIASRPPLAAELFADRPLFTDAMARFPNFIPLVPRLRNPPANVSIEGMLQRFQAEAEEYAIRHQQLAAIRFYLHYVIWECLGKWRDEAHGITNYAALLDQVERWRGKGGYKRVCLVTFNYDTLLEEALPYVGVRIEHMGDYIKNDAYRIIKVHGSMNWARDVRTPIADIQNKNTWQVAYELIEKVTELDVGNSYRIVSSHPIGTYDEGNPLARIPIFPALAIPVEAKRDFACPGEHLDALRECIPAVTKVVVIGWRGVEAHFGELLRGLNQPRGISGVVVGGNPGSANEVAVRLQHLNVTWRPFHAGFTEWVTSEEADRFLKS